MGHYLDGLAQDERADVFDVANVIQEWLVGDERYSNLILLWERRAAGVQVYVVPIPHWSRQGNTSDGLVMQAYTTREDH